MSGDGRQLIVVGAGPAGLAAAVAAGRARLRVLLVERYGFAGGMATAALVNPFAGNCYVNPETGRAGDIVGGIFAELLARLRQRQGVCRCLFRPDRPGYYDAFDELQLRFVADEMLAEAGVQMLYHAWLLDAKSSGGRIESVRVLTKGGVETLRADQFIDSTGDGDLAAAAGVPFDVGRDSDGLCQPCSMMFRLAGVDKQPLLADGLRAARLRVSEYFERARQGGRLDYPFKAWVQFYDYPRPDALHFNMTRVWKLGGLSSWDLTEAEGEGRRQVKLFCDWIRAEAPWFGSAYLAAIGSQIGVRETRRIRGRYQMTGQDVVSGVRFADGVARSGYFIDIHDPLGAADPHAQSAPNALGAVKPEFSAKQYYEIPFRCLQPQGAENLLVACRAISTTFQAHAATRVMPTMIAVGEAAGRAAALAAAARTTPGELDGGKVRRDLKYLDGPLGF